MLFNDEDKFSVRQLTDSELDDIAFYRSLSKRYYILNAFAFIMAIALVFGKKFGYAFLMWLIMNITTFQAYRYRIKASEIENE